MSVNLDPGGCLRHRHYSDSEEGESEGYIPRKDKSTKSGELDEENEGHEIEYRPKLPNSEHLSAPENKESSDTYSKNFHSQSRGGENSRKLSEFDQLVDAEGDMSPRKDSKVLDLPSEHCSDILVKDEYEEIVCDIENYINQKVVEYQAKEWQGSSDQEEGDNAYALDIVQQNMIYLNDQNQASDDATAHFHSSSHESVDEDTPVKFDGYKKAWAFDEIEDDMDFSGPWSSPQKVLGCHFKLSRGLHDQFESEPCNQAFKLPDKVPPKVRAFELEAQNEAVPQLNTESNNEKEQEKPIKTAISNESALQNLAYGDEEQKSELILLGPRQNSKQKHEQEPEIEHGNINIFTSRAQKKKEREAKKKKARKQKVQETKELVVQEGSLPSDSIDISCINRKQSKCEHSEDENEICNLIDDNINRCIDKTGPYLSAEQFYQSLDHAVKTADAIAEDNEAESPEKVPQEINPDINDEEKKGKKKKKKKKKAEVKAPPAPGKSKLSGFQQKLMQEQALEAEKVKNEVEVKPTPKPVDTKAAQPKPQSPKQDCQTELASLLFNEFIDHSSHSLEYIMKMMSMVDSQKNFKISVDTHSCENACKFYIAPYAK